MRKLWLFVVAALMLMLFGSLDVLAQSNEPKINNVQPNRITPGTVVQVNGGTYYSFDGNLGSVIWFPVQGIQAHTYFASSTELVFVVPTDQQMCGEQVFWVRNYITINNLRTNVDSLPYVMDVDCSSGASVPATPKIDEIRLIDGFDGNKALEIRGSNFMPLFPSSGPGIPHPRTEVTVSGNGYENDGTGGYESFGRMTFQLHASMPCGQFNVELKNYMTPSNVSKPSINEGQAVFNIDEYCQLDQGMLPGYELRNFQLPSYADVNEQIAGSVEIYRTGGTQGTADVELVVDGQLLGSGQISLDPNESHTYEFSARFQRSGTHTIEIRVDNESAEASIDVGAGNNNNGGNINKSSYDTNSNCVLDDPEFFVAIDDWIGATIDNEMFFSLVDDWIGQGDFCPSSAANIPLSLSVSVQGLRIESQVSLGSVTIYDTNGREVFSQSTLGNKLVWNLDDSYGKIVSNGVYFVRFGVTNEIRSVLILR